MYDENVIVFISDNSQHCENLLNDLTYWGINYETRNITKNGEYLTYLQENGVFGTPVTIVNGQMILGSQINKIKHELGISQQHSYRNFYYKQ